MSLSLGQSWGGTVAILASVQENVLFPYPAKSNIFFFFKDKYLCSWLSCKGKIQTLFFGVILRKYISNDLDGKPRFIYQEP